MIKKQNEKMKLQMKTNEKYMKNYLKHLQSVARCESYKICTSSGLLYLCSVLPLQECLYRWNLNFTNTCWLIETSRIPHLGTANYSVIGKMDAIIVSLFHSLWNPKLTPFGVRTVVFPTQRTEHMAVWDKNSWLQHWLGRQMVACSCAGMFRKQSQITRLPFMSYTFTGDSPV